MGREDIFEVTVCPASSVNLRNTEAAILELSNGELLLAYTHFYGGAADDAEAKINGKLSFDLGKTWSEPFILQENVGTQNVMSASFLRLGTGEIAFFYLVKNSPEDLQAYVKLSGDEARTWSDAIAITGPPGYNIICNDRAVQLSSGRILVPISASTSDMGYVSFCCYSDDGCRSWRRGEGQISLPKRGAMEPGLVEVSDGVMMYMRTQLGRIYRTFSYDGGSTWGAPEPMKPSSPESPSLIKRIPGKGDLLMIWNNNWEPDAGHQGRRNPLTAAISSDEGQTWKHIRNIEEHPEAEFSYPSILFVQDRVILTYYVHIPSQGRFYSLKLKSIPLSWFYG
jgi:sialidase-1